MSAPLLQVDDLTLQFGGVRALDGVSFDVRAGEFFAVIGPNGAGKTSLLNVLNGVYRPTAGSVSFDGRSLLGLRPSRVAELGVARTFQNLALFEDMTVLDNVVLGRHHLTSSGVVAGALWWGRARREEQRSRAECLPLLDLVGLADRRDDAVGPLPYGVKKRVELARALAMRPKLLLLDEPVAGLNDVETHELAEWVATARRALDLTIIMIEHDMRLVKSVADRVLVLDFGARICVETPAVALEDPRVIAAYVGVSQEADDALAAAADQERPA